MAANVSRVQFAHADIAACVEAALGDNDLEPGSLWLEITESAFEANTGRLLAQIKRLSELGVGLASDDFGTGYSSLSYLCRGPLRRVRSFGDQAS